MIVAKLIVFCLLIVCLCFCFSGFFLFFVCCCLFVLPCALLKSEWLFELFYTLNFLSIDVQVDSVMPFMSYLSFVIL